jgi:hypothetical protein
MSSEKRLMQRQVRKFSHVGQNRGAAEKYRDDGAGKEDFLVRITA